VERQTKVSKKEVVPVLYEDDALLVVHKPAGVLTVPDRWDPQAANLDERLKELIPESSVVHRLDKETSGVMVFAKTSESHRSLSLQFQNRGVQKTYWALVRGMVETASGLIDLPIAEHPKVPGKMYIHPSGKPSQSEYRVMEKYQKFSILHVFPKTGRHHQVRVHLQAIGYPLAVDQLYGGSEAIYLSEFKRNYRGKDKEKPLLHRVSLHALSLEFIHPTTNQKMVFQAPLPKDLEATLRQIRKWLK
jgi:23S rRNA pseudouridine955/2504/2580 synthase/23S rRNA pseudouridine1911/1915/1917 synthase